MNDYPIGDGKYISITVLIAMAQKWGQKKIFPFLQ